MKRLITILSITSLTIATFAKAEVQTDVKTNDSHAITKALDDMDREHALDREQAAIKFWNDFGKRRLDFDRQVFNDTVAFCERQNARHGRYAGN
jgi:hypothetical protein